MPSRPSKCSRSAALLVGVLVVGTPAAAAAQACCAGGTVITPGRLGMHEDFLVGLQEKAGSVLGTYSASAQYLPQLAGASELDFEQDLFAAARVARRGQLAVLVPLIETRRATPSTGALFGGGVGDVNVSGRYDFILAGESHLVPGIALLAGVTAPTGRPPEIANPIDATGIGAFQLNAALALEQIWGPWLVNATGIVAKRTEHAGETLGTQVTLLAAGAYTFDNDDALALSIAYAVEGDASGAQVVDSANSFTTVSLTALWPVGDTWRILTGLYTNPPLAPFGVNHPTSAGITYTLVRTWAALRRRPPHRRFQLFPSSLPTGRQRMFAGSWPAPRSR
jgi:hypothetical protein